MYALMLKGEVVAFGECVTHRIAVQDILSIINIMKTEFDINEQILRVSPSRFYLQRLSVSDVAHLPFIPP